MVQQTGQQGYMFKFDLVISTALDMSFRLHLGMKMDQVN